MDQNQMSPEEAQQIEGIARQYFLSVTGSEEGAEKMMQGLAALVQEPGAKLVHIGNVLFLLLVRGKGVVEMHTIGEEPTPKAYANDIVELANYVKNIGANLLYTYTDNRAFDRVARHVDLPFVKTQTVIDGKPTFIYALEF